MIDWKNKPDGAQRCNDSVCHWLKHSNNVVSYYNDSGEWVNYVDQSLSRKRWDKATPYVTTVKPPLQLTWNGGAPAKATHILQHETSYTQVFATMIDGKLFETSDTTQGLPDGEWFIVSEAPTSEIYYVAGPMTGYVNYNRDMFNAATKALTSEGHAVLNPATLPEGLTQSQYMDICLAMLRCATRIKMLKGWEKSEGARIEHAMAIKSSIVVEY